MARGKRDDLQYDGDNTAPNRFGILPDESRITDENGRKRSSRLQGGKVASAYGNLAATSTPAPKRTVAKKAAKTAPKTPTPKPQAPGKALKFAKKTAAAPKIPDPIPEEDKADDDDDDATDDEDSEEESDKEGPPVVPKQPMVQEPPADIKQRFGKVAAAQSPAPSSFGDCDRSDPWDAPRPQVADANDGNILQSSQSVLSHTQRLPTMTTAFAKDTANRIAQQKSRKTTDNEASRISDQRYEAAQLQRVLDRSFQRRATTNRQGDVFQPGFMGRKTAQGWRAFNAGKAPGHRYYPDSDEIASDTSSCSAAAAGTPEDDDDGNSDPNYNDINSSSPAYSHVNDRSSSSLNIPPSSSPAGSGNAQSSHPGVGLQIRLWPDRMSVDLDDGQEVHHTRVARGTDAVLGNFPTQSLSHGSGSSSSQHSTPRNRASNTPLASTNHHTLTEIRIINILTFLTLTVLLATLGTHLYHHAARLLTLPQTTVPITTTTETTTETTYCALNTTHASYPDDYRQKFLFWRPPLNTTPAIRSELLTYSPSLALEMESFAATINADPWLLQHCILPTSVQKLPLTTCQDRLPWWNLTSAQVLWLNERTGWGYGLDWDAVEEFNEVFHLKMSVAELQVSWMMAPEGPSGGRYEERRCQECVLCRKLLNGEDVEEGVGVGEAAEAAEKEGEDKGTGIAAQRDAVRKRMAGQCGKGRWGKY